MLNEKPKKLEEYVLQSTERKSSKTARQLIPVVSDILEQRKVVYLIGKASVRRQSRDGLRCKDRKELVSRCNRVSPLLYFNVANGSCFVSTNNREISKKLQVVKNLLNNKRIQGGVQAFFTRSRHFSGHFNYKSHLK